MPIVIVDNDDFKIDTTIDGSCARPRQTSSSN